MAGGRAEEVLRLHIRGERGGDRGLQRLEVGAGRDLGHDAAIAGVLGHRARDRVAQQGAAAHDADAGLVAACLLYTSAAAHP